MRCVAGPCDRAFERRKSIARVRQLTPALKPETILPEGKGKRFVVAESRGMATLFMECLESNMCRDGNITFRPFLLNFNYIIILIRIICLSLFLLLGGSVAIA
jgi:hypothetical protein